MLVDPIIMFSLDELESFLPEFYASVNNGWVAVNYTFGDLYLAGAKTFLEWVGKNKRVPINKAAKI